MHKKHQWQNYLLLVASYVFYGFWDERFLILILISTIVDFTIGKKLYATKGTHRKLLVTLSIVVNLGILAFFKYFNFFADSLVNFFQIFGWSVDQPTLNIILPVGISFYTFQTLSYTIDIYRNQLKPCRRFLDFALFVAFFPQLVAGPIERAKKLLPQITTARKIDLAQINAGIYLVIWGLFKKIVIADNMALIANDIFNNHQQHSGFDLYIGIFAFALQIYGDFSGYTDIARGIAKMMGFELMLNFKLPYFALSPSDFWNRWHISLSSWLRDYLYIPLGGNRFGSFNTLRNLALTMLLGGLWHGAAWNFVLWGAFHGFILIVYRMLKIRTDAPRWHNFNASLHTLFKMAIMFALTLFGWLLFRAESMEQIVYFTLNGGFSLSANSISWMGRIALLASPLLLIQIWQYVSGNLLIILEQSRLKIAAFYSFVFAMMVMFGARSSSEFIYFCLLYTSPSPRDQRGSRMPSSA